MKKPESIENYHLPRFDLYFAVETRNNGRVLSLSRPFLRKTDAIFALSLQREGLKDTLIHIQNHTDGNGGTLFETESDDYYSIQADGFDGNFNGHIIKVSVPVKQKNDKRISFPKRIYLSFTIRDHGDSIIVSNAFPYPDACALSLEGEFLQTYDYYFDHQPDLTMCEYIDKDVLYLRSIGPAGEITEYGHVHMISLR